MTVLVGGVGQLYQGDLDLGRRAADLLRKEGLGPQTLVEELTYGAVAVTQRLEDLRPAALVLVGAEPRGDAPATVRRRRVEPADVDMTTARGAVEDAITGYVAIDLVVDVAAALGALPPRTVCIEAEPVATDPSEDLTPEAAAALERVVSMVRAEVRRVPALGLADELRRALDERGRATFPSAEPAQRLLESLETLDRHGRWGNTFAERDLLREGISTDGVGNDPVEPDRALLWSLVEELDRLQPLEAGHGLPPEE